MRVVAIVRRDAGFRSRRGVNSTKEDDLAMMPFWTLILFFGLIAGPGDASRTTRDSLEQPLSRPAPYGEIQPAGKPIKIPAKKVA
jgi:hypothetical protein